MRRFITDEEMNVLERTGKASGYNAPQSLQPQPEEKDAISRVGDTIADVGVGALKGIGSTVFNIGKLGEVIANPIERSLGLKETKTEKPQFLEPEGTAQNIGFGAEQIAEFLIPASKIAKVSGAINKASLAVKAPSTVQKGLSLAGRSALEAGAAGGQRYVQTGGDTEEAKTAALIAAAFPVVGAAVSGVGKFIGATGKKIQQTVIRPNARDFADGFKIENVSRYKVGGSLSLNLLN